MFQNEYHEQYMESKPKHISDLLRSKKENQKKHKCLLPGVLQIFPTKQQPQPTISKPQAPQRVDLATALLFGVAKINNKETLNAKIYFEEEASVE